MIHGVRSEIKGASLPAQVYSNRKQTRLAMTGAQLSRLGALLAGIGVVAGAFGAHALQDFVPANRLDTFETAVRYQMYHAIVLFALGWAAPLRPRARWAAYLFLAGMLLFSGSLYLLVLTDTGWPGAVTPFGGIAFVAGWLLLALDRLQPGASYNSSSSSNESDTLG